MYASNYRRALASLLVIGFGSTSFADSQIPSTPKTVGQLGFGYAARDQVVKSACATFKDADVEWKGANQGTFDFSLSATQESMEKDFGLDVTGTYRTGVTETNATAKFARNTKSAGYSLSYTWVSQYDLAPLMLKRFDFDSDTRSALRPETPEWVKLDPAAPNYEDMLWSKSNLRIVNPESFYDTCGDQVVYKQEVHAKLYLNIRVDFADQSDLEEFRATFTLTSPTVDIGTEAKNKNFSASKKGKFTVSALQVGGNVTALTKIFDDKQGNGGFGVVQCTFGDLTQCQKVLERAIDYSALNFADQIDVTKPNAVKLIGSPSGPAITMAYAKDWRHASLRLLGDLSPAAKELNAEQKRQLEAQFETVFGQWHRLARMGEVRLPRLSLFQEQVRLKQEAETYTSVKLLKGAIQSCYDRPLDCESAYNEVRKNEIKILQPDDYVFEAQSYAQYCDAALAGRMYRKGSVEAVKPSQRMTDMVFALNAIAEKTDASIKEGDLCGNAERVLSGLETIDLSRPRLESLGLKDFGLLDLEPLKALQKLRSLNLSGIGYESRDLQLLMQFNELTSLTLDDNKISSIEFLVTLPKLQKLALNQNPLTDVAPLRALANLQALEMRNAGDLTCPFPDRPAVCDIVDYAKRGHFLHVRDYGAIAHVGHQAFKFADGQIRIFGGLPGSSNERYDVSRNELSPIVNSRTERQFFTVTPLSDDNNLVLIVGGLLPQSSAFLFAASKEELKMPTTLHEDFSRIFHRAEKIGPNQVLVFGGFPFKSDSSKGANALLTTQLFSDGWFQPGPSMREPRAHHQSVVLDNGQVLVTGGTDRNGQEGVEADRVLNTAEIFDGKEFKRTKNTMSEGRFLHQMTKLADGRVLITGGFTKSENGVLKEPSQTAEIYDPATGRFSKLDSQLSVARAIHQTILLGNGQVLILGGATEFSDLTGGLGSADKSLDSAELFDPARNRFVKLGASMIKPRAFFTATQIDEGRVLIVGGVGTSATSVEMFSYDF